MDGYTFILQLANIEKPLKKFGFDMQFTVLCKSTLNDRIKLNRIRIFLVIFVVEYLYQWPMKKLLLFIVIQVGENISWNDISSYEYLLLKRWNMEFK